MNKKIKRNLSAFTVLATSLGMLVGCGGGSGSSQLTIKVWNFKGGFGDAWLNTLKSEYETAHKNDKYGDKTGVKFVIVNDKKNFKASELVNYDLFFLEGANYVDYVSSNALEDITDAVTGNNPYETNKTIYSKMTESQKEFYNVNNKYYAIPHYSGTYGITYDAKLFEENGYYYKKDHPAIGESMDFEDYFTSDLNDLAGGPDGIIGVKEGVDYSDDDGLPETFEEFFWLCSYLKANQIAPLQFAGDINKGSYITAFASSLMNNLLGAEQANLNYSFSGSATDLVKVNGTEVVVDKEGNPVKEEEALAITEANGYETIRSEARFNTIEFLGQIFENNMYDNHANNDSHTYTTAQKHFVYGEKQASTQINRSAMLIDGTWWENEAKDAFAAMDKKYPNQGQSLMERQFKFMPLPKAKAEDTHYQTYTDNLNAAQVVRKGVDATVKEVCIDFLKYINTDEKLVAFNKETQTTRALNYTLSDSDLTQLSPYGKSVYKFKNSVNTEIVYPISGSNKFINGFETYFTVAKNFSARNYNYLTNWFAEGIYDGETILSGIYSYYKTSWSNI